MRRNFFGSILAAAVLSAMGAAAAFGQTREPAVHAPSFGTTSRIQYHVGFLEFAPAISSYAYNEASSGSFLGLTSPAPGSFVAHLHVPTGAHLASFELDSCDTNNVGNHISLDLVDCDFLGGNCQDLGTLTTAAGQGCSFITADLTPVDYTMDNNNHQLFLTCTLRSGDNTNVLLGGYIGYKLQVSPAPAVATFADVPTTSPQFKFVEALVAAGITAGCGSGNYCPTQPVTRGQMAVFLASALGLHFPD